MGQSASCYTQQADSLSESDSEQNTTDYFGPQYASNYLINTKFLSHFQVHNSKKEEQFKRPHTVSSTNYTDQEIIKYSIQNDDKYLTNSNNIFGSHLDWDSNNINSSYDNSINLRRSILKKNVQKKTNKQPKGVKFINVDIQIPFDPTKQKQLGELLKRKQK